MKLTPKTRKALAASLKSPVAQHYIARLNREESEFKDATRFELANGRTPLITRSDWLFTRTCDRRPDVRYTDSVQITKKQTFALETLLRDGGQIWCGIEHAESGATAILCKHDAAWIVIYEDGTSNRGDMPMLRYFWPNVIRRNKKVAAPSFTKSASGGFKLNRGA